MSDQPQSKTPLTDAFVAALALEPTKKSLFHDQNKLGDFARSLELKLNEEKKEAAECRGYLYGCDEHKLWQGASCIGCLEAGLAEAKKEAHRLNLELVNRAGIIGLLSGALQGCQFQVEPELQKRIQAVLDEAAAKGGGK